jgi:HPt (histidine-containing phosphotransfer) domain-containing protein
MRAAAAAGDAAALKRSAHSLKGAAANMGARRLSLSCAELEGMARREAWDGAATLLADVERQVQEVVEALEAEAGGNR